MSESLNGQDLRHIGVQYFPSFVSGDEQRELLQLLASLTYRDVLMRGMVAKRKVCCFGFDYVYARRAVVPTEPMPPALARLRDRAERETADGFHLCQAIVTSYPRGAGINWHVDAPTFGPSIIGVSFGGVAQLSLKRGSEVHRISLAPGSVYILRGPARDSWLHRIAPVGAHRYSVTFRSLNGA